MKTPNPELRYQIAQVIHNAGEGHIPSAYSILEIVVVLYDKFLKFKPKKPDWPGRDYFILSKGHGCAALYVILAKHGFITQADLEHKSSKDSILGGHPDMTQVPGVEASTGSLGHGVVTAMGIALGLKIKRKPNKVIALIGDGECNEGTVWETALVAANLKLGNLCVIVDDNESAKQILPVPQMVKKWRSFGWEAYDINGHNEGQILATLKKIRFAHNTKPKVIITRTVKGKGVSFVEGHGKWHHKIPTKRELADIKAELL